MSSIRMLSDKFFFEASKRERGLMGNEPCQKHATIAPHALCSKMRIQGYKYTIGCLEHILLMIDGRCAVCTPQYNFVRLISTLEVLWQPAKCRVKVANAAAHSSRTRAKLVTNDHSKFIYFSRATRIYPSFMYNFPTGISRYRQSCDIKIRLFFLLIFHCLVDKPRMPG
jgi:hypothetical protein